VPHRSQPSVPHCPFLNRDDPRCAENFSLDRLDHALRFCFDNYRSCSTYLQLLVERRVRRIAASSVGLTDIAERDDEPNDDGRLVQLTIRRPETAPQAARAA
jgi:hypothetical protein